MFCRNCGKELDSTQKFCDVCGTLDSSSDLDNKKNKSGITKLIFISLLVIATVGAGYYIFITYIKSNNATQIDESGLDEDMPESNEVATIEPLPVNVATESNNATQNQAQPNVCDKILEALAAAEIACNTNSFACRDELMPAIALQAANNCVKPKAPVDEAAQAIADAKEFAIDFENARRGEQQAEYKTALRFYYGVGVTKDYTQAFDWASIVANNPRHDFRSKAMKLIGDMYSDGNGVVKDEAQAVHWYTMVIEAKGGVEESIHDVFLKLGNMYLNGRGVVKNETKAFELFSIAAPLTGGPKTYSAQAQAALGNMYANGVGVTKDLVLSYAWYTRAVNNNENDDENLKQKIKIQQESIKKLLDKSEEAEGYRLAFIYYSGDMVKERKQLNSK